GCASSTARSSLPRSSSPAFLSPSHRLSNSWFHRGRVTSHETHEKHEKENLFFSCLSRVFFVLSCLSCSLPERRIPLRLELVPRLPLRVFVGLRHAVADGEQQLRILARAAQVPVGLHF